MSARLAQEHSAQQDSLRQDSAHEDRKLLLRLFKENVGDNFSLYVKAIISMVAMAATTALSAWIMRHIVNDLLIVPSVKHITIVSLSIVAIFTVKGLASYFQIYYLSRAGNRVIAKQQSKIYAKIVSQGAAFFQANLGADLIMRVTNSAAQARGVIDLLISSYIRDLLTLLALVAVMIYSNFWLSAAALILGPAIYFLVRKGLEKIRHLAAAEMTHFSQIIQVMQETTRGIRVIKAFALESVMIAQMNEAIFAVENKSTRIARLRAITSPVMETMAGFTIASIVAISGYLLLQKHGTPGDLMAFITAVLLAYEPAKRLANSSGTLQAQLTGVRVMFAILDEPATLSQARHPLPIPASSVSLPAVVLDKVTFAYSGEADNALTDISLRIAPNSFTAIVGPSGAGKSSLVNLLLRLYDPSAGHVLINGQDIQRASFADMRAKISYVSQDVFLFHGDVKYNIGLGRAGASLGEIVEAAKLAGAHEFIMQLPQQYNTKLSDNARRLSGGQAQRLALARAILHQGEIMLVDEATSALDSLSEQHIIRGLTSMTKYRTIIAIAHRFNTIAHADNIIVLEHGRIVQQGTKEQLLAQEHGLFKQLYAAQLGSLDKNPARLS